MCLSLSAHVYNYVCRQNTRLFQCLHHIARKSPQKHSLQLIYNPVKMFSMLASLARAAIPWLSKATCPCRSTLSHCGCVTQSLIHIDVSSDNVLACTCTVILH